MKILLSIILGILFVTAAVGLDQEFSTPATTTDPSTIAPADKPTTTPATTPTDKPTSTDKPTTTPSTTTDASTTTPTDTTSTTPTDTSTTSTTEAPTTTPADTSTTSTTEAPTTSTAASTTKAPQPTPPPAKHCSWNVTQNNVTCMRIDIQAIFVIHIQDSKEYIALSENATADQSDCSVSNGTIQRLVLSERNYYTLTMTFVEEGNKVFVNETTFEYKLPQGDGSTSSDSKLFAVKVGNSYMCKTEAEVHLNNVTMELYDVQIQAFGEHGDTNFGSAEECEADDKVSDAVPIAVGCALAALIIIVLIAYLVGRRRSRQRGYQSV